jgi:hypothetical protein
MTVPISTIGALDLQALVELVGGYDRITPEQWAEFDRLMADWQARRRGALVDAAYERQWAEYERKFAPPVRKGVTP